MVPQNRLKKLETDQVRIRNKSPGEIYDTPNLALGYKEEGFRLEPRSDGLFLLDGNGQTRFSNFSLSIRESRYLHERGKSPTQELQLEIRCGGRTHTLVVNCKELTTLGETFSGKSLMQSSVLVCQRLPPC